MEDKMTDERKRELATQSLLRACQAARNLGTLAETHTASETRNMLDNALMAARLAGLSEDTDTAVGAYDLGYASARHWLAESVPGATYTPAPLNPPMDIPTEDYRECLRYVTNPSPYNYWCGYNAYLSSTEALDIMLARHDWQALFAQFTPGPDGAEATCRVLSSDEDATASEWMERGTLSDGRAVRFYYLFLEEVDRHVVGWGDRLHRVELV